MTEDDWSYSNVPDYVEDAMRTLRDEGVNSPRYSIAQGTLYENLRKDERADQINALDISRKLNNGEVEEAWETLEEIFHGQD
jgi:DNA-binding PadR family transcriptional regulator